MKIGHTILIHLIFPLFSYAQMRDTSALIRELKTELENKRLTIENILTDTDLLSFHQNTAFRGLVRIYAPVHSLHYTCLKEPGRSIRIVCKIADSSGQPLEGALVYCYQTDARGWYGAESSHFSGMEGDRRHARLFGYVKSDDRGEFILHTIEPNGYPQSSLPAHIHIEVQAAGYQIRITEFLFDDDPRLNDEARKRARSEGFIVAKEIEGHYTYSLILSKE